MSGLGWKEYFLEVKKLRSQEVKTNVLFLQDLRGML